LARLGPCARRRSAGYYAQSGFAGAAAAIGGEPERDGLGDSAYVADASIRGISSSKFRDMMSSSIDTMIQKHQDSRGAVADEDLLDVLLTVLRTQREDELLDPPLTCENIKAVNIIV